jgi:cytoskeletal protein RodZ
MSDLPSTAKPIGKAAQEILGVRFGADKPAAKAPAKSLVDLDEAEDEPKKGIPWFLVGSIVVLVIVIGIAGYMAYKYWRRRQQDVSENVVAATLPVDQNVGLPTQSAAVPDQIKQ